MSRMLSGDEPFHLGGIRQEKTVLDFWRWADSDLKSNALRGRLAEYLVASALGIDGDSVRREWVAYDLLLPPDVRIEVKSASYVQGWTQRRPSTISFGICPTLGWDPDTAEFGTTRRRHATVYVFALLGAPEQTEVDPLDLAAWQFFVLPAKVLDDLAPAQKSIRLKVLLRFSPELVEYAGLPAAVRRAVLPRSDQPSCHS